MPIFGFDVKCVGDEKLVPITRYNSASIGPAAEAIALKRMEWNPENGPLWELGRVVILAAFAWLTRTALGHVSVSLYIGSDYFMSKWECLTHY